MTAKVEQTTTNRSVPWHALSVEAAAKTLEAEPRVGLSEAEARARLERVGPNALPEPPRRSLGAIFLHQFRSPLIYLLFLAAAVALVLGHRSDAAVIFTVVLLNAVVGALQEGRAERSLAALRQLVERNARVLRGGSERLIPARELVPGDVLLLEAGDSVVADARLVDGAALQLSEAALTGESVPVGKALGALPEDTPLADRRDLIFAGTHVTSGRARALVVATGGATEIGRIAALAEAAEQPKTPLEQRIAAFGRLLMFAAAGLFVLVVGVGLLRGVPGSQLLMVAISQVVGMIPEGLPVAMTIALAVGVQQMARRRAMVRRLSAVETLGSTTVICSDKTGTLTRNEMTVTALVLPGGQRVDVSGVGYAPEGAFTEGGRPVSPATARRLLEAAVLCNDAALERRDSGWRPLGDPTEVALVTAAEKAGIGVADLRAQHPRRGEIPFDSDAKLMATWNDTPEGPQVFLKGAPEQVLALCASELTSDGPTPLDADGRRRLSAQADALAAEALRVLAVGVVSDGQLREGAGFDALNGEVTWLGLVGQLDPPRPEVKQAVASCRAAGIRPVMVTGDHRTTAQAIARSLGIARPEDVTVDGAELERLSDATLDQQLGRISVFARVHPAQKMRIVEAYQRRGEVVAMTGDGVNDAPALARADVGIAMGQSATSVPREASKIVLADDNFATIVAAVEEGRVVYRNIKKAVLYLLSTSLAEVVVLLGALLLGYPPPLAAVQILWINLVTEGTVTVNLIMEPAQGDEMRQHPISRAEPLLTRPLLSRMAVMTPAIALSTLGWFIWRMESGVPAAQVQTETFTVLAVCQWFNVLNCRSERSSAFSLGILRNPWLIGGLLLGNVLQVAVVFVPPLSRVFHTVPIPWESVLAIGAVASLVLWVEELRKFVARRRVAV